MQRRRFLQLSGACATAAVAGCLGDSSDDTAATASLTGAESGTATETAATDDEAATGEAGDNFLITPIDRLWDSYNDGDIEGMQAVFHPDSSAGPTEEDVSFEGEVSISSTTVLERSDESATVEADLTYETDADRSERTDTYELRSYEGRWVIWSQSVRGGDAAGGPVAPQIAFDFGYDTSATDGSRAGVLTVTHSAGDNVDAARLSISGSGVVDLDAVDTDVTAPGTNWGDATGADEVTAGTSVSVGVTSDCDVSVIWTSPDGDDAAILAEYDGPDA